MPPILFVFNGNYKRLRETDFILNLLFNSGKKKEKRKKHNEKSGIIIIMWFYLNAKINK